MEPGLEDALILMRAVLRVLDDDLTQSEKLLALPTPAVVLGDSRWEAAESARLAIERDLLQLEHAALDGLTAATAWRANAESAASRGHADLAQQARRRAAEADDERQIYEREASAVRAFLEEWAVRVTRARPQ